MSSDSNSTVTFRVKVAYMIPVKEFTFPKKYTISQMISELKEKAHETFEIDKYPFPEVEVVEAGQPNNLKPRVVSIVAILTFFMPFWYRQVVLSCCVIFIYRKLHFTT